MAPLADTADGKVDVIRVGEYGRFGLLRAFPKVFSGAHINLDNVSCRQASRVQFALTEPVEMMLDGERLFGRPREIRVLPSALSLCI